MDLRDILTGLFWLVMGNIVFYFVFPLFGAMIDGMATTVVGSFGLTDTIVALSWGGYIMIWGIVGIVIPLYLIIKGAGKD